MAVKNLGLINVVFSQLTPPTRTDVLWYDTANYMFMIYNDVALEWQPTLEVQLSGVMTVGSPQDGEVSVIVGLTAYEAGEGFQITIKNTVDSSLYRFESNGRAWCYVEMTESPLTYYGGGIGEGFV